MKNERATVELTVRYGEFGHQSKTVAVQIDEGTTKELLRGVELSDEPFSLFVASPGLLGGKRDAVTLRRTTFKMRRQVAEDIAKAMVPALLQAFGVNDQLDGYRIEDMPTDEVEFYRARGRLPRGV